MKRAALTIAIGAVAVVALSSCSAKQIDVAATGAQQVPGTGNLFRFCDGNTLIYFSNSSAGYADDYEFIVYDGCSVDPNAKPRVAGE